MNVKLKVEEKKKIVLIFTEFLFVNLFIFFFLPSNVATLYCTLNYQFVCICVFIYVGTYIYICIHQL